MTTTSASSPLGLAAAVGACLMLVAACAVAGIVLAAGLLGGPGTGDAHHTTATKTFRVAQDVPTSFGFVAIEHAEALRGLTAKDLAGNVHGIGSYVGPGQALVQASATIKNTQLAPLRYSPDQFRLVATRKGGAQKRYALSHATVRPGVLQPDAAVDVRLSFVAPRDGSRLSVEFADPGRHTPLKIDLERGIGRASAAELRAARNAHGSAAAPTKSPDHEGDH
jgi:hypothetical protein